MCVICFFFFKQKTAYEMRISDWSSDVCSSDLDDGSVDWHQRAVAVLDRVPVGGEEKVQARSLERVAPAPQHRQRRAGPRQQHEHHGGDQHVAEQPVGAGVSVVSRAGGGKGGPLLFPSLSGGRSAAGWGKDVAVGVQLGGG